jgi:hypothetical protein
MSTSEVEAGRELHEAWRSGGLEITMRLRRDVAANGRWAEELTVIENIEGFGADLK